MPEMLLVPYLQKLCIKSTMMYMVSMAAIWSKMLLLPYLQKLSIEGGKKLYNHNSPPPPAALSRGQTFKWTSLSKIFTFAAVCACKYSFHASLALYEINSKKICNRR